MCGGCLSDTQDSNLNLTLTSTAYENRPRMLLPFHNPPLNNIQVLSEIQLFPKVEKKKNLMELCCDTPTHTPYTPSGFILS